MLISYYLSRTKITTKVLVMALFESVSNAAAYKTISAGVQAAAAVAA